MSRINQRELQTGNPKGFFRAGDAHPDASGYVFICWNKHKKSKEVWGTNKTQERIRGYLSGYRERNKSKQQTYMKDYYESNSSTFKSRATARKRSIREAPDAKDCSNFYEAARRISDCLGIQFHVDHIIPLSKDGKHAPHNLQIVPAKWNLSKSNNNSDVFRYNKQHTPTAKKLS